MHQKTRFFINKLVIWGAFLTLFGGHVPVFSEPESPDFLALSPALNQDVLALGKGERLVFQRLETPQAILHILVIPAKSPYSLDLGVANGLATLPQFAKNHPGARALINAGYFDPANGKTISNMKTAQGKAFNTLDNARLTGNPAMEPYLEKINNRPEFRRYLCSGDQPVESGQKITRKITLYEITATHEATIPLGCTLVFAVGGGPKLLPLYTPYEEGFVDTDGTGRVIRDPIGLNTPNARTAVGLRANGDVVLVMAGQKAQSDPAGKSGVVARGLSLPHLTQVFRMLGVTHALNLDGGSSSGVMFINQGSEGMPYYGKLDAHGKPVVRPLKSVLMVMPQ